MQLIYPSRLGRGYQRPDSFVGVGSRKLSETVQAVTMNHIRFSHWQVPSMMRASWAFVDAYSTSYAQGLGDMWLAGLFVHDDAFLTIRTGGQ